MIFLRHGSVPPGFGGPGAPPGFGSGGSSSSGDNPVAPPRRPGNRNFGKTNRNPVDDPRLRSFIDLIQELYNSLGERGFIVRDSSLRWSLAPNPYLMSRDPTVNDDADDGVLLGEMWHNLETGAVWYCRGNSAGAADWIQLQTV